MSSIKLNPKTDVAPLHLTAMKIHSLSRFSIGAATCALLMSACSVRGIPALSGNAQRNTAPTASTERVSAEVSTIENRVIGSGKMVARNTVDVPLLRTGLVAEITIREGDMVNAGDVLLRLDPSDLENAVQTERANYLVAQATYSDSLRGPSAAELKAAQAALTSANAAYQDLNKEPDATALAAAEADLRNADFALKQAQAAYDRRAARDPGVGGSTEALNLEKATNDYAKAKAAYDAKFVKPSRAQLASASASIANAQRSLDALKPAETTSLQAKVKLDQAELALRNAEKNLGNAIVRAPISGMVTSVGIQAGEYANTGMTVAQLVDFADPAFEAQIDEIDLGTIKIGQRARVLLQSYPATPLAAEVSAISRVGVSSGNTVVYKATLSLKRNAGTPDVLLNMSGTAEIIVSEIEDAIVVPNRALIVNTVTRSYSLLKVARNAEGQEAVETVQVEIGARGAETTQIVSGITAGDVIAIPAIRTQSTTGAPGGGGGGAPPGP